MGKIFCVEFQSEPWGSRISTAGVSKWSASGDGPQNWPLLVEFTAFSTKLVDVVFSGNSARWHDTYKW